MDIIRTENQDIVNRWYHSTQDADLFVWLDQEQNIIKQQLSFYGQVIEWNIIDGVRTGCLLEEEKNDLMKVDASELVQFDRAPQSSSVKQALELLECITVLPDEEKRLLIHNFSSQKTAASLSPEEFSRKFSHMVPKSPEAHPSLLRRFWLRLRRFFG